VTPLSQRHSRTAIAPAQQQCQRRTSMYRNIIVAVAAVTTVGAAALAPTSASAWGGHHHHGFGWGFGPSIVLSEPFVTDTCYSQMWVSTKKGLRLRTVYTCD
jgi:hypothetical protein